MKSRRLRYDFETGLNDYLMARARPLVGRTTTLALDFSDLSKPFGLEVSKSGFSLEKLRVRTFRRLRNVFSLCVVAYLFVTRYLRASSRFKGIVKAIRDNCTERSLTTHPLLANLRSLIGEERIRNITGRPRKPPAKQPPRRRFSCFGRRPRRLERKVSTGFGPVRKYFSPNVFRGLVKIRDNLSLKIRDKGV